VFFGHSLSNQQRVSLQRLEEFGPGTPVWAFVIAGRSGLGGVASLGKMPSEYYPCTPGDEPARVVKQDLGPKGLGPGLSAKRMHQPLIIIWISARTQLRQRRRSFPTLFFTEKLEGSSQPQATLGPCFTRPLSWQDRDNGQAKEVFKLNRNAGQNRR
jgi:hypothetical protein